MKKLAIFSALAASVLNLPSCASTKNCPISKGWRLATELQPSPVPYTPKLVFYARETGRGDWLWRDKIVTYEELLRDVALVRSWNPQPLVLFSFAEGWSCEEGNRRREEIARAARCSNDGVPCLQGTIAQFEAHS